MQKSSVGMYNCPSLSLPSLLLMFAVLLCHFTGCIWKNKLQETFQVSWTPLNWFSRQGNWDGAAHESRLQGVTGYQRLEAWLANIFQLWKKYTQIMKETHQSYAVELLNFKNSSMDGAEPVFRPPATQKAQHWVCFSFIAQSTGIKPLFLMTGETKSKKSPLTQFSDE